MATIAAQHAFQGPGGSADRYVNVFNFNIDGSVVLTADSTRDAFLEDLAVQIFNFYYDSTVGAGDRIADYLSPAVHNAGEYVRFYNTGSLPPRTPLWEKVALTPRFTDTGLVALPPEVALVMTSRAAPVAGVPSARTRGRMFIGPFNTTALGNGATTQRALPEDQLIGAVQAAASVLHDYCASISPPGTIDWSVHSRTQDNAYPIVNISVDDEFDTMRSRGSRPTANDIVTL